MTSKATMAGQPGSPVDSTESKDAKGVSSRRLKKREIDRRCQRQARERTKTRIAYLEGLVEDFRRQDASGQVATLMKQLQEVEAERDIMAKTLKDIQKAMDIHKPLKASEDQPQENYDHISQLTYEDATIERKPSITPVPDGLPPPLDFHAESNLPNNFDLANFSSPPNQLNSPDMLFAPEVVRLNTDSPISTSQALVQSKAAGESNPMLSKWADNWASPRQSCSCHTCHERRPGRRSVWQGNYWRYANEVLSERFEWGKDILPASDEVSEDVPIRAVLEGWDAVAKRGPLHPSWQILRRIDQTLFVTCPITERLAIMRAMHTLLQFHTESTSERYARLPPWYMRRPSQKIAHSYAIDYFAWPGIRERFIFNEHDYCDNEFWQLFCSSLRILWPYEFRDCYTRETGTGLYKFNPMFDEKLCDIKCWTMGPDIFHRFPELYSDFPTFNQIPQSVTTPPMQMQKRLLPPAATSPKARQTAKEEEEVKPVAQMSPFVPVSNTLFHVQQPYGQVLGRPMPNQSPDLNPHQYSLSDYNTIMALDAFAYGAINEADFASVYPEILEGYPNVIL